MVGDATKDAVIRLSVLRSTLSNYAAKIITLGAGFFLTPFILAQIGPVEFGLWALASSLVGYGSLLDFGISGAVVKYVAEFRARGEVEEARQLIATALQLYTFLGLLAIVLSAIIAPIFPTLFHVSPEQHTQATWLVLLLGVAIGITIPSTIPVAVLRGLQRFDILNLISVVGTLLSVSATIAILLLGGGLLGMVAIGIPLTLLMQIPSIWLVQRAAPDLRFGWRGAEGRHLGTVLSYSWSLFVLEVAGRLETRSDEVVIGAFMPIAAITPYALARRLGEMAQILTDQFSKVIMPLASQLDAEHDHMRLRALYFAGTRLTLGILLPVAGAIMVLARPLLAVWVGADYEKYADLVVILTLANLVVTSQWPAASILQGMTRHRLLAFLALATGIANVALSVLLVGPLGLEGVALGTLIPYAAECLFFVLPYTLRTLDVSPRELLTKVIVPTLMPGAPMLVALYALEQLVQPTSWLAFALISAISVLIYLVGYWSVGASPCERRAYLSFAQDTLRLAQMRLKRS